MRYHYISKGFETCMYGETYECDHPVYSRCTLFRMGEQGLAIIQQRYDPETKKTWWGELDPGLPDKLYLQPGFYDYFQERSNSCRDGLYPTVTVRQIMWALRMKPLPKKRWETVFDRKDI